MPSMSACLLGSINLSEYVLDPFDILSRFDFDSLAKDIRVYVEALNECLFENLPFMPLKEQKVAVKKYQAIGLGYFGVGDMLIKLQYRYGSSQSIRIIDQIGELVVREAIIASSRLNEKYDSPEIILSNEELFYTSDFYKNHFESLERYLPINTSLLTCAPTGSLSTMFGVSGGIEPIFSLKMSRKTESLNDGKDTWYEIDIPVIEEWKKNYGTEELPEWITNSTAMNLKTDERILIQATWQKHIDNAISSTVNLSEDTTIESVEELFLSAWKQGLKGITIYRTGCKRGAILVEKKEELLEAKEELGHYTKLQWGETLSCSNELIGLKRKIMTGCGSMHVGAYYDRDGNLREVFFNKGSDGGCNAFMTGLSRMASLAARSGANLEKIIDQFNSVPACPAYVSRTVTKHDTSKGKNCPSAIGNALIDMQKEIDSLLGGDVEEMEICLPKPIELNFKNPLVYRTEQECIDKELCPQCYRNGEMVSLTAGGGCFTCDKCGFTKCE